MADLKVEDIRAMSPDQMEDVVQVLWPLTM